MNKHNPLAAVVAPVASANGLPNAHYIDDAMFAEEKQSVLFNNWAGVGFAAAIPNPGDAKPVTFLGMPLLLLRDRAGDVAVFQNTCRHRGMILVEKAQNIPGAIRCPYHSWCYGLDGALKATPHVGGPGQNLHEGIDKSTLGLIPVRSRVWQDVIFVNIDGSAAAFEAAHADLLARWAEFDQPLHHGGTHSYFTFDVQTNWKLAVENYCESYHLPWIHPGLNSYSRLEDHYNIAVPGKYSGQGTYVYRQLKGDNGEVMQDFAGLSDKWNEGGEYVAIYPNVLLGVQRDHTFSIILEPKSCEQTVEHVNIYYATAAADTPECEPLRVKNAAQWTGVFEEDLFVVEGMQKGRHGPLFDGGRFSPVMDGPTHNFHAWVAEQIMQGRNDT